MSIKDGLEQWNEMQRKARLKYALKRSQSLKTSPRTVKKSQRGVTTYKKAKKLAWDAISLWVRMSAIEEDGLVVCVTCKIRKEYKKMHAGHFVPGRSMAILFDIRGLHPQCYWCNVMLKGNPRKYNTYMVNRYGQEVVDELDRLADDPKGKKYSIPELLAIREYYQDKLGGL